MVKASDVVAVELVALSVIYTKVKDLEWQVQHLRAGLEQALKQLETFRTKEMTTAQSQALLDCINETQNTLNVTA